MKFKTYRKWDIVWVDLPDLGGHEMKDLHPAIIVSPNYACEKSATLMVICGTSAVGDKEWYPEQLVLPADEVLGLYVPTRFDTGRVREVDIKHIRYSSGTIINTPYLFEMVEAIVDTFELRYYLSLSAKVKSRPQNTERQTKIKTHNTFHMLLCPVCKSKFIFNDRNGADYAECRNCHVKIKLKEIAIEVECPKCNRTIYGKTNIMPGQDGKSFKCKCKTEIPIVWDDKQNRYRTMLQAEKKELSA